MSNTASGQERSDSGDEPRGQERSESDVASEPGHDDDETAATDSTQAADADQVGTDAAADPQTFEPAAEPEAAETQVVDTEVAEPEATEPEVAQTHEPVIIEPVDPEPEPAAQSAVSDNTSDSAESDDPDSAKTMAIDTRGALAARAAQARASQDPVTEVIRTPPPQPPVEDPATEVFAKPSVPEPAPEPERRYTAPGFDAGSTTIIEPTQEPATEVFAAAAPPPPTPEQPTKTAAPQAIPPRGEAPKPPRKQRSWGWVVALLLVIAALVAVAILGTILLTRDKAPVVSEEDRVRDAITEYDSAIKKGDLALLRSITCGATRDTYVGFNDRDWAELHRRVAAAEEYPVIASIDQVVINGQHAEANVTTFMAKASDVRSTRSIDLQFTDEQWKICQDPAG